MLEKKTVYFKGDLPDDITFGDSVAVDTETMGLNLNRDRLCVVQLSRGDGVCYVVKLDDYNCPNLKKLLADKNIVKIFHYARFDVAIIKKYLKVDCAPVYCTKIASRLTRTNSPKHGLKNLCYDLLGVELSKEQQTSDWGAPDLSEEQQDYAANDVLYLHLLKEKLDELLVREGRKEIAHECFDFLNSRAKLDLLGWQEEDIFAHH